VAIGAPPRRPVSRPKKPAPPTGGQPPPQSPTPGPRRRPSLALFVAILAAALAATAFAVALTRNPAAPAATTTSAPPAAASKDAVIDAAAKPAADWKAFDPALAPAAGGTLHTVTFRIQEKVLEVAPGVKQLMWTFNGQVPGPTLHGHIGDVFNVTLVNDGAMAHSIDFHASQTSMDTDMRSINPGQSLVYQFKAEYAGIFMYHCGTPPALIHIGSGMYGAVVIDPPGLAPVDHEFVLVQSELYLGPQGKAPDFDKMSADKPDAVVFNGYYNQYKYSPLTVKAGERIRIWVIDDGPSDISSFHVVGTIFDTVYKEGAYTLPRGGSGGSQALDLMPAQGGFVELTVTKPGMYAMVTHKFSDASRGALGMIHAG
jgi:nitrite reductase (NO-forming)